MNKKSLTPFKESTFLLVGEVIISALTVAVFFLLGLNFSAEAIYGEGTFYKVITGVVLGSAVIVINYATLSFYISGAADRLMELRGSGEMSEEEIEKFTSENVGKIQKSVQLFFIIRITTMIGALVVAFLTKQFNIIATVIPILAFRPLLAVREIFNKKTSDAPFGAAEAKEVQDLMEFKEKNEAPDSSDDASEGADGQ